MPSSTTLHQPRFTPSSGRAGFTAWFVFAAFFLLPFTAMSAAAAFPATKPGVTELKTLPAGLLVRSEAKGDYFKKNGDLFRPLFRYIQRKDISMTTPVEAQMGETSAMYFWIATTERAKAETDLPPAATTAPAQPGDSVSSASAIPAGPASPASPISPASPAGSVGSVGDETASPAKPQPTSQSLIDNKSVPAASPVVTPEGVVVLTRPERLVVSHGGRGGYSRTHFEEARDAALAWLATRPDLAADGEPYGVYWNSPFMPGFLKRYEVHIPVKPAPSVLP